jgi:hypothetical protein
MKVRKVVTGSALAAGLGVAAMMGAGSAAALGFSYDNSAIDPVTVGTGANSDIGGTNNQGLAISVFGTSSTSAGNGTSGNNLLTIDGHAVVTGSASDNNMMSVGGSSSLGGSSNHNNINNVGGVVTNDKGNAIGAVSLSACGTSFSGQAAHVTVSPGGPGDLC